MNIKKSMLSFLFLFLVSCSTQIKNFSTIKTGIYRSAQPNESQLQVLEKFNLKTIVYLHDRHKPKPYETEFAEKHGIKFIYFPLSGFYPKQNLDDLLEIILDNENQPVLIHCTGGRHRTGMISALIERTEGKSKEEIIKEYRKYSGLLPWEWPKKTNEKFIEEYNLENLRH